jgi:scyllo-inositol 2-dehydrogenase (NADP+)
MPSVVKVAAIGLGWVAQHRHLPVMDRSPRFEVVGVIDRAAGRAQAVAEERGYRRHSCAGSLQDVPWIDEVDCITIATAPMAHHALVAEALGRGKHVLTEKPFTMTVAEGAHLVRTAAETRRCLAIVHNFQFARSTLRLKRDIERGVLGPIRGIDAVQLGNPGRRLPRWYEQLPLGLFYDESPHLLYLMRSIAGELRLAHAITVSSTAGLATPARIEAWFETEPRGYPIKLSCNFESPVSEWYLVVFGERAVGIVDVFRDIYVRLPNDGAHDTLRVLRTSVVGTLQHWLQYVVSGVPHLTGRLVYGNDHVFSRLADAIDGAEDALAPVGPQSALAVLRLQHAIIERHKDAYALA